MIERSGDRKITGIDNRGIGNRSISGIAIGPSARIAG
jgi:hypothetical protein